MFGVMDQRAIPITAIIGIGCAMSFPFAAFTASGARNG
jgi:hypothetical protein